MKKLWPLPLALLGLILSACTGSQEPPLPALVAMGGEGEVRFFRARDLQGGTPNPVGTWTTPSLQDLAHSQTFGQLYLLFPDRLEAYSTQGFSETTVPQPSPTQATFPNDVDCTGGYLRLGQNQLLARCPEAGRAFLWSLDASGNLEEADLTGLPSGVRLALFPQGGQELLAYMSRQALGYRPALDPTGTPSLEKSLDPQADQGPYDLQPDRLQGRLLGLAATRAEVRLYTLEGESLSSRKVLADFPRPSRLALDPVGGGVAYGQGFQVLFPRESPVQRQFDTYTAGLVGQDGYLYLVQGQALEVYDLVPSPPLFLRSLNLGFSPTTLAFIPVE
ncbi:hypothetical protein CSW29_00235 [Thermus scotoductus]|uniref:Lipoprotein n=1 Tax=Thermus scotoductus TaxID=37636 RepID=A0A430UK35_THESC|nr:hypothetical protein [Thermus scotoductus]RTH18942.1 hypothetical protein CSW41_05050 [Thermus scotoductus]RTI03567.1 hypothetical protein CSW29_00235 [Thermus scotoductus]